MKHRKNINHSQVRTGVPGLANTYTESVRKAIDKRAYAIKIPGLIRLSFVALLVIGIIIANFYLAQIISDNYIYIYTGLRVISVIFVLFVIHKDRNTSYILTWTVIILAVPVVGLFLYLLWGRRSRFKKQKKQAEIIKARIAPYIHQNEDVFTSFIKNHPENILQATFLKTAGFPPYQNTKCTYYDLGEKKFVAMFDDIRRAKKFIFLEYFILADGILWQELEDLLIVKAREGLEVRLLFDDFGSIIKAPRHLMRRLRENNVQVIKFNPVARYISKLYINYRNHQKCCIIDGQIAYTGGTNLADEYANLYPRFGHWKDTAIKLEGEAVRGLTTMFLTMWESESEIAASNYQKYMPSVNPDAKQLPGYFIPYWDSPLNNPKNPAEDIYRSIINNAKEYIYICSPYFIVDDSMIRDICRAAESGVDVRIITPGQADKWFAYVVTQSHYEKLMESGVRVFQYSPGFIHAKTVIADHSHVITGCINFDYRSFHLHFENSVYICGDPVVDEIYQDFTNTFAVATEIDLQKWYNRSKFRKAIEAIMRIFSPLL